MAKKIIETLAAPAPIGPYSQAVEANGMVFLSGAIAIHPETGELLTADLEIEAHQVMRNIRGVLNAAGLDFSHVVKTSIFLKDMDDFAAINKIYGEYFEGMTFPARETVQVARLPKDVNVEISVIAVRD